MPELGKSVRISYDPKSHGRNAGAIRFLNEELASRGLKPGEAEARLKAHVTTKEEARDQIGHASAEQRTGPRLLPVIS